MPNPHAPENGHGEALPLALTDRNRLQEAVAYAGNLGREAQALSSVLSRAFGSYRYGFDPDELRDLDLTSEIVKTKVADVVEQIEVLSGIIKGLFAVKAEGGAA